MTSIKVGDIITRTIWDSKYRVTTVYGDDVYDLFNLTTGETVHNWYYSREYELLVTTEGKLDKSPVECKIAVMRKRFENRYAK